MELVLIVVLLIAFAITSGVIKMNEKAALVGAIIQFGLGIAMCAVCMMYISEADKIFVSVLGTIMMAALAFNLGRKIESKKK